MSVNNELADLFAKIPKECLDASLAKGVPLDEDELWRIACRDAAAFLLTYEQVCSTLQPDASAEDLADELLRRLDSPAPRIQRPSRQTFAYFVCENCAAKYFSSVATAPCPRCGHTNRSNERLHLPWHR